MPLYFLPYLYMQLAMTSMSGLLVVPALPAVAEE